MHKNKIFRDWCLKNIHNGLTLQHRRIEKVSSGRPIEEAALLWKVPHADYVLGHRSYE